MELKMDMWKYFSVLHEYHEILDPMSTAKLDEQHAVPEERRARGLPRAG